MKKQTEKTAQTKADLTAAFWRLYKEKPINKITVKDVTDAAGYYRSTLYYYFEDVYDILEYIEAGVLQDWENSLTLALQEQYTLFLRGEVEPIIQLISPFYNRNGEYIAVLLSPSGDPLFQQKIKDTVRHKLFSLLEIPDNCQEALLLFECTSSGMLALFVKWYEETIPLHTVVQVMQHIINPNPLAVLFTYSTNPLLQQLAIQETQTP